MSEEVRMWQSPKANVTIYGKGVPRVILRDGRNCDANLEKIRDALEAGTIEDHRDDILDTLRNYSEAMFTHTPEWVPDILDNTDSAMRWCASISIVQFFELEPSVVEHFKEHQDRIVKWASQLIVTLKSGQQVAVIGAALEPRHALLLGAVHALRMIADTVLNETPTGPLNS